MVGNYWKVRAIDRRAENKALKKRIRELLESRDGWKSKYMSIKQKKELFENELKIIKKKLNGIIKI
ncbi:MAG: hypothetical protein KAH72_04450 [Flavobacteriaceae bacterium]|nr:hypothetical protein [Flavobacteriaceae bacterium]